MEKKSETILEWGVCPKCKGNGKIRQRLRKISAEQKLKDETANIKTEQDKTHISTNQSLKTCKNCSGSGLVHSEENYNANSAHLPTVAIIGGGIGGIALAVACLHRGIPFKIFERDLSFDARSQGYGLTLQQASKALSSFGISHLEEQVISTKHVVHDASGAVVAEWGRRKWLSDNDEKPSKQSNIHIARQNLRLQLLQQIKDSNVISWNHQFIDYNQTSDNKLQLRFKVDQEIKSFKADLLVGADGIRSAVRTQLLGESDPPLHYLDCMVILGICPLSAIKNSSALLDAASVFQTSNGSDRIYIMPYDANTVMWQLSFKISEVKAEALSKKGAGFLKDEAVKRTQWHDPIPQIVKATLEQDISGYPVYDRELLNSKNFEKVGPITLLGDAAHPMSPFKGQGANQALLDALSLARGIYSGYQKFSTEETIDLRTVILQPFEAEMIERSASKVKDSAAAADFLHSEVVLTRADAPRGSCIMQKNSKTPTT